MYLINHLFTPVSLLSQMAKNLSQWVLFFNFLNYLRKKTILIRVKRYFFYIKKTILICIKKYLFTRIQIVIYIKNTYLHELKYFMRIKIFLHISGYLTVMWS